MPDSPWVMRTYAGHSSAAASNELYRRNLAKGQTGLSIAFDLPTQTGYDPDAPMAHGEVGRVGVPISHLGDMRTLLAGIPLDQMNTSMTINATAMWLFALYIALAEEQGVAAESLAGTTQNDIIKEYLSRGTYIYPPEPSVRLISDMVAWSVVNAPKWNPVNICSYHLQEAGATPVQELAYALSTAITVLDAVKSTGQVDESRFGDVVGRVSFFVNAGMHFVEEMCKMRAFTQLWDEIASVRYGITDPKLRRFRYGVQVNSLGLTESQPENNVARIMVEMLGVTLSRDARARAVQLPAWNEALGLPRPWDQQWSLRMQQVLAYETDLLDYDDIFTGSVVVESKVADLVSAARVEMDRIAAMGGMVAAVQSGYVKRELVASLAVRRAGIESGADVVAGVNAWTESEPSPLTTDMDRAVQHVDAAQESSAIRALAQWRKDRDPQQVESALSALALAAASDSNLVGPSITCARAGVTTQEWADALRGVFGEYRAPTGVEGGAPEVERPTLDVARAAARDTASELGRPVRLLVAKPGLDGHSNGAEQVTLAAAQIGMEVTYEGIRHSPAEIVAAAIRDDVDCVGLSILSGSHLAVVPEVVKDLIAAGREDVPVVVGGIIPDRDAQELRDLGVADVFSPKDYNLGHVLVRVVDVIRQGKGLSTMSVAKPSVAREGATQ